MRAHARFNARTRAFRCARARIPTWPVEEDLEEEVTRRRRRLGRGDDDSEEETTRRQDS